MPNQNAPCIHAAVACWTCRPRAESPATLICRRCACAVTTPLQHWNDDLGCWMCRPRAEQPEPNLSYVDDEGSRCESCCQPMARGEPTAEFIEDDGHGAIRRVVLHRGRCPKHSVSALMAAVRTLVEADKAGALVHVWDQDSQSESRRHGAVLHALDTLRQFVAQIADDEELR